MPHASEAQPYPVIATRVDARSDEFRANDEAWRHFTDVAGVLDPAKLAGLRATIAPLVEPSAARWAESARTR